MRRLLVKRTVPGSDDGRRHAQAHAAVLDDDDPASVTSAAEPWWRDPDCTAIIAEDEATQELVAGIRIHRWSERRELPLQDAAAEVDPYVGAWIRRFADRGVAELCGLWRATPFRASQLGSMLSLMGIAITSDVEVSTLFCLCDTRNVARNLSFGFRLDPAIASRGSFEYPRTGLYAHVLRLDDTETLPRANPRQRDAILGFRRAPVGSLVASSASETLHVDYDLQPRHGRAVHSVPQLRAVH